MRRCSENPFSYLPCEVYHDLVDYTLSLPCHELPELSKLCLLLINYRLHRIDLSCFEDYKRVPGYDFDKPRKTCSLLIRELSKYTFPNVQSIYVPFRFSFTSKELGDLIQGCPNLKTLHTAAYFDLSAIENCKRLRSIRIHSYFHLISDFLEKRAYSLMHLEDLNVLSVCNAEPCFRTYECVANILIHCRNVFSVGMIDSSMAINYIINERSHADLDFPFAFRLRRCFWGYDYGKQLERSEDAIIYKTNYTNIIRTASTACPLVEELVMQVFQKESLKPLGLLRRLSSLDINFTQCDGNFLPDFFSLLSEIGHNLKHLSLEGNVTFPVNALCNYCINLESLQIKDLAGVEDPIEPCTSLKKLKRFYVNSVNQECLQFMLKYCTNVRELFLGNVQYLDDIKMRKILHNNSLAKLELLSIDACNLSEQGLYLLVKSATNLKNFYLGSPRYSLQSMIREMKRTINYVDIPTDFFYQKLHNCTF
ncbi:hypothetical protein CDAR_558651 [Caerostris darwini]|nr:hypothetical protein CDAR_558651 [Caerostris darwini]